MRNPLGLLALAVLATSCQPSFVAAPESRIRCEDGACPEGWVCDEGYCRRYDAPASRCGDGSKGKAEQCDCGDGTGAVPSGCTSFNSDTAADACRTTCVLPHCGDRVKDQGEECDDGNLQDGDGCSKTCVREICGNGVRDPGEVCDDRGAQEPGCSDNCLSDESCGNGYVDYGLGEECDEGSHCTNGADCTCPPGKAGCFDAPECSALSDTSCAPRAGDGCGTTCKVELCGNGEDDPDEVCDNGRHCADGTSCTKDPKVCVGQADSSCRPRSGDKCSSDCLSKEVCGNGIIDVDAASKERCDDGNTADGDGCSHLCQPEVCGNTVRDANEVCDVGRRCDKDRTKVCVTAADCSQGACLAVGGIGEHCSADCLSDESCGNGVEDFDALEQCDDGGHVSRDGCSSGCLNEVARWTELPKGALERLGPAMAYDSRRRRVVLFGGERATVLGDTWEWDGYRWAQVQVGGPSARRDAKLVFDSGRGRMVLFGGSGSTYLGDTWEYDGAAWKQVLPSVSPPARASHMMAYDPVRKRTVLFGGADLAGDRSDTWEWDGTVWTQVLGPGPGPRRWGAMAPKPVNATQGRVILFGGETGGSYLDQTWAYDGTWTQLTPTISGDPTLLPRSRHEMVFSSGRNALVVFGGYRGGFQQDTWHFDGTTWAPVTPSGTQPSARAFAGLVYDSGRAGVLLFGGQGAGYLSDTYEYADLSFAALWSERFPSSERYPSARRQHAMAFDSGRGRTVLFGGDEWVDPTRRTLSDTWEHDGRQWAKLAPVHLPPIRREHAMAYDVARGRTVMFGGWKQPPPPTPGEYLADTCTWDGQDWSCDSKGLGPTARAGHAMAFDPLRKRTVLFGGETGVGYSNELWEWDGAVWNHVCGGSKSCSPQPVPLRGAAMTFDVAQQRVVLFGGRPTSTTRSEAVWTWDGTRWAQLTVAPGGADPRNDASLVYDTVRKRVVLYGGVSGVPGADQVYEDAFDLVPNATGWEWKAIKLHGFPPPPRRDPEVVWNAWRRELVAFGGYQGTVLGDTWTLGFSSPEPDENCQNGNDDDGDGLGDCADPDCAPLVFCAPACADGTVEQDFGNGVYGCAGKVSFAQKQTLCAPGVRVCTANEWVAQRGTLAPTHNYWTADALRYGGTASGCFGSPSLFVGADGCPGDPTPSPMRVCAAASDPLGNTCTWVGCGLEAASPSEYFGGCQDNDTAGALCCLR